MKRPPAAPLACSPLCSLPSLLNLQETRGLGPPQTVSVASSEEAPQRGPMLVKRGHLDGRAAGEREGRDQDVVVEAMQLLALLRVRSVEEHALDLHHVLAPSRRAPAPGEDVRDPRRVAPRPALLAP